ncbi:Pde4c [Symbiodinium natans]|uniref:Pde4c protein n=1 Tax=Symbiodinium natans TaxID=878477 RepID=A0A812J6Q1_9DINO|nr:Pde4c [Symbiodinium natans]
MGVDPGDVIVSSIEEDENGNWKAIFSANATKTEMDTAMGGKSERTFPPDGPDVRLKRLQGAIRGEDFAKDDRFTMLRHADANLHVHEIERIQITDTAAWCRGLGGFTTEDTRKLTGIFLTPEAIYRKAYNGRGLQEEDLKRLRGAGFTDADLRRLGLLGYGLSEDEATRLEIAGFGLDDLQRRLLTGDLFSKDEQSRLKAEGLPLERLRRLLAGTGRFSKAEKERLSSIRLPEMEIRRRLILGEDFDTEDLKRLEDIDLPLHELRRRVLGGEIFDRDERLRLDVVGLREDEIMQRLADRAEFSEDEMFSLESAGFDVEDLHRRLHGESTFAPTELQRLQALGFTEEEIIRRLCDGMGFEDDELRRLAIAGFSLAKLTRRVFGTSNPTKEEEEQSRILRSASVVGEEGMRRLDDSQLKKALRRLNSDAHLLSEDEHNKLAEIGLPLQEIRRRVSTGEGFSEWELQRLNSAGLSESMNRLAPNINDMDEEDRLRLEDCGIPLEEIKRRTLCGEDFTLEEIDRIHANGFSIDALQRSVMAEEHDDDDSSSDFGEILLTKAKAVQKTVQISMPFADELARLLQSRYVSHEKSATNAMQFQALDELRAAASSAADDPSEVTLAELARAIAKAIHAEVDEENLSEATELLQMLRAQFLLQLLEGAVHLEDIAELGAMLAAVEGKVRELDLFRVAGDDEEEAEGMLLGFYPRDLDPRKALRGLITRARTKQEKANAEARLEEVMGLINELALDNIMQVQKSLSSLQEAMRVGEEAGASPVLMFSAEELLRDLQLRKARYDDFHTERNGAWAHLQQSLQGLQGSIGSTLAQKKTLQHTLLTQDWRLTRIPSQFREEQLTTVVCPVGKGLQTSLTNFLEMNFASTEELQASTENLVELLPAVASLVAFFQLPAPTDVFQLHDRKEDLLGFSPQVTALVESASPPIGPIPALLKDVVRDMDKLTAMWQALELEAMPKGLHQAIMSGIKELVEACLSVCVDKESVIGRVRDDRGGNSIHLAAIHGHWQVIQVLLENGGDVHGVNDHQQSALDVAIETLHKLGDYDHQVELSRRLQETIDLLDEELHVISYEYVKYEKKKSWWKRPETMLKWLRLKNLLEYHFDNLKRAFVEIDTNHSGGIVKYEWEAMFGAEGQVEEALVAADLESNEVFGMLDGIDVEGKDMVITKSAFELLDLLDWHLTSKIWQDLLLKPLTVKQHHAARQRAIASTTPF